MIISLLAKSKSTIRNFYNGRINDHASGEIGKFYFAISCTPLKWTLVKRRPRGGCCILCKELEIPSRLRGKGTDKFQSGECYHWIGLERSASKRILFLEEKY